MAKQSRKTNTQQTDEVSSENYRLRHAALHDLAIGLLYHLEMTNPDKYIDLKWPISFNDEVRSFESILIQAALLYTGGNKAEAAKMLGLKPNTLYEKVKRLCLGAETEVP